MKPISSPKILNLLLPKKISSKLSVDSEKSPQFWLKNQSSNQTPLKNTKPTPNLDSLTSKLRKTPEMLLSKLKLLHQFVNYIMINHHIWLITLKKNNIMLILMLEREPKNLTFHLWWWIHSCSSKTCKETKEEWDKCQCHSWDKWVTQWWWVAKEVQWWEDKTWDITTKWEETEDSTIITITIIEEDKTSTDKVTTTIITEDQLDKDNNNKDNNNKDNNNKDNSNKDKTWWTTCKDKDKTICQCLTNNKLNNNNNQPA